MSIGRKPSKNTRQGPPLAQGYRKIGSHFTNSRSQRRKYLFESETFSVLYEWQQRSL